MNETESILKAPCRKCGHGREMHGARIPRINGLDWGCCRMDCGCLNYEAKPAVDTGSGTKYK